MEAVEATTKRETFYVVQAFSRDAAGVHMDSPIQAATEMSAIRTAERLAGRKASVIALARTGDLATGDFEEPVVIARFGDLAADSFDDLPF